MAPPPHRPGMNAPLPGQSERATAPMRAASSPRSKATLQIHREKSDLVRCTKPVARAKSIDPLRNRHNSRLHRAPPPLSASTPPPSPRPPKSAKTGPKQPRPWSPRTAQAKAPTVPALPHSNAKSGNATCREAARPPSFFNHAVAGSQVTTCKVLMERRAIIGGFQDLEKNSKQRLLAVQHPTGFK